MFERLDDAGDGAALLADDDGLAGTEQVRWDVHLSPVDQEVPIRELEQRLAQAAAWAKKPKPKVAAKPPRDITNSADLIGKTRLWFDLIHLALQTDSSRLVTLQLLGTSSVPPIPGVSQGHHDLSHHGKDPTKIAQLKLLELEKMKTLRDFLAQLKQTREESESLLDRTMVFFSRNLGDAGKHSVNNLPVLLAGGGFKHGQHLAFDESNHPPLSHMFVSMLQRMGIEARQVRFQHRHAHMPGNAWLNRGFYSLL